MVFRLGKTMSQTSNETRVTRDFWPKLKKSIEAPATTFESAVEAAIAGEGSILLRYNLVRFASEIHR